MSRRFPLRPFFLIALLALAAVFVAACGGDDDDDDDATATASNTSTATAATSATATTAGSATPAGTPAKKATLRLGYFPNITHAQGLVGVKDKWFEKELGSNVKLETKTFNAGPAVIEALLAGAIDASYIGPNPAINGYVQSDGKALRIIAGGASAGASLVVRPEANINSPTDFARKKIATPQLGNTQDVALRAWLKTNGLKTQEDGGNVQVLPTANADALALFKKGDIDGAWVPEPWATRLVLEANGKVFLDEKSLWPNGDFVTTHLIVSTKFLEENPEAVDALLRGHVKVTQWITEHPEEAKTAVNDAIGEITSARLAQETVNGAWKNLTFTWDPIASSLRKSADDAYALGFLGTKKPDLAKIYDVSLLNKVLAAQKLPAVKE